MTCILVTLSTNIIQYTGRPWDTVDEMNAGIVDLWNSVVGPDDHVWVLGDVAMGKIAESLPIIGQCNGRKTLVFGNHDRVFHATGDKLARWKAEYSKYFGLIAKEMSLPIEGIRLKFNHFPYIMDHTADVRYVEDRPKDEGGWLLHGHLHTTDFITGERQIHIGIDTDLTHLGIPRYTPIPMDLVIETIKQEEANE